MDIRPGLDPDEQARRLARGATGAGSPTDWFDDLYAAASRGQAVVPWDRGGPHPLPDHARRLPHRRPPRPARPVATAFDLVVEIFTVQSMPPRVRPTATAAVADTVALGGTLLVIGAVGNGQPVDGPPWPLTRAEVDAFGGRGLSAVQVEEIPEPHRWRAEFRRP